MPVSVAEGVLAVKVAGAAFAQANAFGPRFRNRASFDRFVEEGWESPFGIDYVFVHSPAARDQQLVDGLCEKVAIRWVNFARLEWSKIERKPPANGTHTYDWSDMDGAVRTWQRNGVHVMVSARFFSPWATAPKDGSNFVYLKGPAKWLAVKGADYLQKPELRNGRRVLVAFHDDHIGQNHDQQTGEMAAAIPVQGAQIQVTSIITDIGQTAPKVRKLDVADGVLRIKLTEYPVFIEAAE